MIGPLLLAAVFQWQQHLEYEITARLDESRGVLAGTQQVRYQNNSPDTLRSISFHLYLNAFRPGSKWSDADSAEGRRRFNDLKDPEYGYNRIGNVLFSDGQTAGRQDGKQLVPVFPFAPDSTIVRFVLPNPVPPGGEFTVGMDWEARPSTLPRRQGRKGRHFDFAQWYPRVVAYDKYGWEEHPLYPGGEFYGDFGNFRVVLDVPEDQVIGATGVPVCGDPGWERANRGAAPVEYAREAYGPVVCSGIAESGRKLTTWVARDVHHFALSMDPEYRHEGGKFQNVLVHVLYRAGDERTWSGAAVRNTVEALAWLDWLFGRFPWPQITNVHRLESGGTEFPMMVMDGSAGLGLIVHEVGHNYLMGILANNEWKEGWLDEGFTSFQTSWYLDLRNRTDSYSPLEYDMLLSDLDGWSQTVSRPGETFRDFSTYNAMTYDRGELFFQQLRLMVGDSTMRRILRTFYESRKLKHVDEAAFRAVAEEVSHRDLGQFFAQWLHSTELYDYAVGRVRVSAPGRLGGSASRYLTRVEVRRRSPGVFPVTVVVRSGTDSAITRASGFAEREWVELETVGKPREVEVDPEGISHDWNALDNRKRRGLLGFRAAPRTSVYLDKFFSHPIRRDGLTLGLVPTAWYNDEGGLTLGLRARSDYLGRFQQNVFLGSLETRRLSNSEPRPTGFFFRARNPVSLQHARISQTFEAYRLEGRTGLAVSAERELSKRRTRGPRVFAGAGIRWLVTSDTDYLDPTLWEDGGTIEASTWWRMSDTSKAWKLRARATFGGGIEYRNRSPGTVTEDSYDVQGYARAFIDVTARRAIARNTELSLRGFAGGIFSNNSPLKQRQFFVAGADPYEQFGNPFVRSRGALLVRKGVHYLVPGGGGVRGFAPSLSATRLAAVNAELGRSVFSRPDSARGLIHSVRVAAFGDLALGNGDLPRGSGDAAVAGDAGIGIRLGYRIGDTFFTSRIDFPLYTSRGDLAAMEREHSFALRWVFSVQ